MLSSSWCIAWRRLVWSCLAEYGVMRANLEGGASGGCGNGFWFGPNVCMRNGSAVKAFPRVAHAMPAAARRVVRLAAALSLVAAVASEGCQAWCGQWACPGDYCDGCWDFPCKWTDTATGVPDGAAPAGKFEAPFLRSAPAYSEAGAPMYDVEITQDGGHAVTFDAAHEGHRFTPFHLGTNMPLYTRSEIANESLAPALAAAGMRVWRWPGGASANFWCPSFPNSKWDACFDAFPTF
eukprot:3108819-Prymnesium_polylepis.1